MPFLLPVARFFEQAHVKDLVAQPRLWRTLKTVPHFYAVARFQKRKLRSNYWNLLGSISKEKSSICTVLGDEEIIKKVPKDAKEDWESMAETLSQIHEVATNSAPSVVVEEAIGGWYQLYLRATYENWPRREEDLESLVDFASKHETLAEMLSQLVLLSSESGDRVVRNGERCIRLSTIHPKGFLISHVFIIGLADGLFLINEDGKVIWKKNGGFLCASTRAERPGLALPALVSRGNSVRLMQADF